MTTSPIVRVKSPGRICLFGEHQDYLGLPVIATAINRYIKIQGQLNTDPFMTINTPDINTVRKINLEEQFKVLESRDYIASTIRVLRREGIKFHTGCQLTYSGNIPYKAGASSSSAIIVGLLKTLLKLYSPNDHYDSHAIAHLAYQAEVLEHGEPGGMMDHYSISLGNVIHIDTATYEVQQLGDSLEGLIISNSLIPKEILEVHGRIRPSIERAISILRQNDPEFKLAQVQVEEIDEYCEYLPESLIPIFYATITNHEFTRQALKHFKQESVDLKQIGILMNLHHKHLRDYLQITVPKINLMINRAMDMGALGAKINGSGGGGTIAILAPGRVKEVCAALEKVGAMSYPVKVDKGARYE
ncbi:MAG: galactokinase family protein [Candidatus Marinimicrobia bacterium]|nr:galactokinase family protein [Candidatus Neomarinimicrobiota bacterium]